MAIDNKRNNETYSEKEKRTNICSITAGVIMVLLSAFMWFGYETRLGFNLYFGFALVLIGAANLVSYDSWTFGWKLPIGLINITIGFIYATSFGVNVETLPALLGLWALFLGIIQISSSYHMRLQSPRWSWMLAAGFMGVIVAFLVIGYPLLGWLSIRAVMSLFVLIYGLMEILEGVVNKDINVRI